MNFVFSTRTAGQKPAVLFYIDIYHFINIVFFLHRIFKNKKTFIFVRLDH